MSPSRRWIQLQPRALPRDIIVALRLGAASLVVRLTYIGTKFVHEQKLATIPATVTGVLRKPSGDLVLSATGGAGGVYSVPRNGGKPHVVAWLPRATAIAMHAVLPHTAIVVQSGHLGPPVIEPRGVLVDLDNETVRAGNVDLTGYRPLGITGVATVNSVVGFVFLTGEDGSVGMAMSNQKPKDMVLGPTVGPGGTTAIQLPGGCRLYASPDLIVGGLTDARGTYRQPVPIPNVPALRGRIVFAQWVQQSRSTLVTSHGMAIHIL